MSIDIISRISELNDTYYLSEADIDNPSPVERAQPIGNPAEDVPHENNMMAGTAGDPAVNGMLDPTVGAGAEDPYAAGGYGMEPLPTSTELGRIYELDKIYKRLTIIKNYLKDRPEREIVKLHKLVDNAFEVYQLIINNIDSFKDKIDVVILKYYKFIERTVLIIEKFLKDKHGEI